MSMVVGWMSLCISSAVTSSIQYKKLAELRADHSESSDNNHLPATYWGEDHYLHDGHETSVRQGP